MTAGQFRGRPTGDVRVAVEPVCLALRAAAAAEAGRLLAAASADAQATVTAARAAAAQRMATARADGAADAAAATSAARARARGRARATVLRAHREAYQQLREASRAATRELCAQPGYPQLLRRLRSAAQARLDRATGEPAFTSEPASTGRPVTAGQPGAAGPAGDSTLVAEAGGRRVDYSLDGFADRAVDALGTEVERLWAP